MPKTTMTPHERLQLLGLLTLAAKYDAMLQAIRVAMADLTESDPNGHVSDAILDEKRREVDALLERLGIRVESNTTASSPSDGGPHD